MTLHPIPLNFLIYEEIFFFYQCGGREYFTWGCSLNKSPVLQTPYWDKKEKNRTINQHEALSSNFDHENFSESHSDDHQNSSRKPPVTCKIPAGLFPCIIRDGQTGEKRLKMTVGGIMRSFKEAFPEFICKFTEANIKLSVVFLPYYAHTSLSGCCAPTPIADSLLLSFWYTIKKKKKIRENPSCKKSEKVLELLFVQQCNCMWHWEI